MNTEIVPQYRQNLNRFFSLMLFSAKLRKANPLLNSVPKNMDISDDDVQNLLKSFATYEVKYLLIGGMAGAFYGHTRTTQDMDIWVKNTPENRTALIQSLKENLVEGAPYLINTQFVFGYTEVPFGKNGFSLDLGEQTKAFSQADFDTCYAKAITGDLDGIPIKVILLADLIREKQATARPKDLGDLIELERIQRTLFPNS
jgi:predicted nucleotidyltransferase